MLLKNVIQSIFKEQYSFLEYDQELFGKIYLKEFGFSNFQKSLTGFTRKQFFISEYDLYNHILSDEIKTIHISCTSYKYPWHEETNEKKEIFFSPVLDFDFKDPDFIFTQPGEFKRELMLYISYLQTCFNLKKNQIHVYFSGKKGVHIHFSNFYFENISSLGRISLTNIFKGMFNPAEIINPKKSFACNLFIEKISQFFINKKKVTSELLFLKDLAHIGTHEPIFIKELAKICMDENKFNILRLKFMPLFFSSLDESLILDVSKLIRFPGTIHQDTGLLKKKMDLDNLILKKEHYQINVLKKYKITLVKTKKAEITQYDPSLTNLVQIVSAQLLLSLYFKGFISNKGPIEKI